MAPNHKSKRFANFRQHWKLRLEGFRKRAHRYSGLVSFAGVLVILSTFIVRDVLKDQAKDGMESLQSARRQYESARWMGRISAQLERMERYITTSAETGEGQQATEKGQKSETDVQDQERFGGFGEAIRAAADGWLNDYGYLKDH